MPVTVAPKKRGRPRRSGGAPAAAEFHYADRAVAAPRANPFADLVLREDALQPLQLAHRDDSAGVWLYQGDCLEVLDALNARYPEGRFDAIFADPPYFLSNGGITCQNGRMVRVDKGDWDKSQGPEVNHAFNRAWLERCQRALKPNGTLWVTGTHHVIYSVGYALQQLGFKILNDIIWEKPNPPPNLSCRYFTHSTEIVLWAAKNAHSKHVFNYPQMRQLNGGKQMKSVWRFTAPGGQEKLHGRHPTQKPIALVERCLLASTNVGGLVLDPFMGSGTTAVAALRIGLGCVGIEMDLDFLVLAQKRLAAEFGRDGSPSRPRFANDDASSRSRTPRYVPSIIPFRCSIRVSVTKQIDLDLLTELIDPISGMAETPPPDSFARVFHETKFVFLSCAQVNAGSVVHTTVDVSICEAWGKAPSTTQRATTHIIRCETEIFRVKES